MDIRKIQEALSHIYTDMLMLEDGSWVPEKHSINDTIENIELIAKEVDVQIIDTRNE